MTTRRALVLGATVLGTLLAGGARAAGDPEVGRYQAQTCLGCHGIADYANVYPTYKVPKLAGQHAEYIVSALQAYKAGERSHDTMRAQASALSEEEMQNIAAWFASLEPAE